MIYLIGPARAVRDAARGLQRGTFMEITRPEQLRARRITPDDEVRWVYPDGLTLRDERALRIMVEHRSQR